MSEDLHRMYWNSILVIYGLGMSATIFVMSCLISNTTPTGISVKNIITHDAYALDSQAVELNIKNIIVNKTSDNTATVKVLLAAHNPNTNTVLLDGIHYNVYVNNSAVSSGDIGMQGVIDVMRSEPEFPIISNDTVVLKDVETIHKNEVKNDVWNIMTSGKVCFSVNGTYSYRQTANLAASGGGNEFQNMFPDNCK